MKHTSLYDCHIRDASEVINLKGVARAMQYQGHAAEHQATREGVTLCDVSHMGEIDFEGPDALALVQKLITNDATKLSPNQALYSVMCAENGMVIDDLVCFRLTTEHFRWVVNVTKTDEDYQWVVKHSQGMDVKVSNISTDTALLALQGPESREVLQRITKADLSNLQYYWFVQTIIHTEHAEVPCLISRTGYTGERGYEIMVARELAPWVWDAFLMAGRPLGILPHGVAARESLRTEAGYLLNGNDMDAQTSPFEAGLGWVVKFSKDFVGKEALARIKTNGVSRKLVGLEVQGHFTIRNGYPIFRGGSQIGRVSSGPLSPSLVGRNLGLGYVGAEHAAIGTEIEIDIRGKKCKGHVVATPFCPRKAKEEPRLSTYSPYDLRFAGSHVWARVEDGNKDVVALGLTEFGQRNLGDILSVDLPKVGDSLTKGIAAGWLDSYRRSFDLLSPVTGEVIEVNEALAQNPTLLNKYPYARGGALKVRVKTLREFENWMSFKEHAELVQRLRRYDEWTKDRRIT